MYLLDDDVHLTSALEKLKLKKWKLVKLEKFPPPPKKKRKSQQMEGRNVQCKIHTIFICVRVRVFVCERGRTKSKHWQSGCQRHRHENNHQLFVGKSHAIGTMSTFCDGSLRRLWGCYCLVGGGNSVVFQFKHLLNSRVVFGRYNYCEWGKLFQNYVVTGNFWKVKRILWFLQKAFHGYQRCVKEPRHNYSKRRIWHIWHQKQQTDLSVAWHYVQLCRT